MKKNAGTAIMLFRRDLRLVDNPALNAALQFENILPVYIDSSAQAKDWALGGASRWWLHHSLISLQKSLREKSTDLLIAQGDRDQNIEKLTSQYDVKAIFWNRLYDARFLESDKKLKIRCRELGLIAESFNGSLLAEPWQVLKSDKTPYMVYTAYWNAFVKTATVRQVETQKGFCPLPKNFKPDLKIENLGFLPRIKWDREFYDHWHPGEQTALKCVDEFLENRISSYDNDRNIPNKNGTSRLSPHLHFGEVSPHQIWQKIVKKYGPIASVKDKDVVQYSKELIWRDFSYYLLFHFPQIDRKPLRKEYENFPWLNDKKGLQAWQRGQTGYPIIDAGMRELWRTGWMHNRVRMIVASFLIKDMLIPWQKGAEWFWDTLVDADLASNTQGWQWTAGSGADAAPYFRIFNPTLQSEKFDTLGQYIKKWVPELENLGSEWIHEPGEAPEAELRAAGIILGKTYPLPIVEHQFAKIRAMKALKVMNEKKK